MALLDRVHHLGVPVANLDRSLQFYQALTGGELLFVDPMSGAGLARGTQVPDARVRFAMVQLGNLILELIEYEQPRGRPFDRQNNDVGAIHIAFEVPDIQAVYTRLQAQGIPFNAPPYTFTEADGSPHVVGATFAYFRDPDGIQLEIFQAAHS
jgi:catechol 2,3-dioxygenase-like lactoylglutathione lyase family enzyme